MRGSLFPFPLHLLSDGSAPLAGTGHRDRVVPYSRCGISRQLAGSRRWSAHIPLNPRPPPVQVCTRNCRICNPNPEHKPIRPPLSTLHPPPSTSHHTHPMTPYTKIPRSTRTRNSPDPPRRPGILPPQGNPGMAPRPLTSARGPPEVSARYTSSAKISLMRTIGVDFYENEPHDRTP